MGPPQGRKTLWGEEDALGRAAIAAGASGLMVEVHTNPAQALSDGEQALLPQDFARLAADARKIWGLLHP